MGILIAAALLPAVSSAHAAGWWNEKWIYRRLVTIPEIKPGQLPGSEIAVVTMPTGGLIKPDGSDIRVANYAGDRVPSRVLMVGPGDQARVAFAAQAGVTKYYVYCGNENPPDQKELEIKRGVLLESWEYSGGPIKTLDQVKDIFKKPSRLLGREFRDRVFLGYNPFGPQDRTASIFTGWFTSKQGQYHFVCSSTDASFLLIDDQLVIDNGGLHPVWRDVRFMARPVQLNAGLHKLTLYHVSTHGDPVAVAAWKQPGEDPHKGMDVIPADVFTPVYQATPGPMERYGRELSIDFMPAHAGEMFMIDRYFQRYSFEALTVGVGARNAAWQWDFGDGQKASAPKLDHVYLIPGQYTVTLTGKTSSGDLTRTNRIFVSRPWEAIVADKLDSVRQHADIVAEYDFATLSPEAASEAIQLFKRADMVGALLKAGEGLMKHDGAGGDVVARAAPIYAETLVSLGKADKAVEVLLKGARMTQGPAVCAALLTQAGTVALESSNDAKRAMELFEQVIRKYEALTTAPAVRRARIGVGDVWRARGDFDNAQKAYREAGAGALGGIGKLSFAKGDFARHVEDYLRAKSLDDAHQYLDLWADAIPADKLEGYWSLLKVKLHMAQSAYADAAREAEILTAVNPGSIYAAELLMQAADAYNALQQPEKAIDTLKRLAEKYRESPLAAEAENTLKAKGIKVAASRPPMTATAPKAQ